MAVVVVAGGGGGDGHRPGDLGSSHHDTDWTWR